MQDDTPDTGGSTKSGEPQRPDGAPPSGVAPRRSTLARAAAIVGGVSLALSCCGGGLGGSLAVLFGMMSLERIRASGGALRGRGLAWAGIWLGVASLIVSLLAQWGISTVQQSMNTQLRTAIGATFAAVDDAGRDDALSRWSAVPGSVLTGEEIRRFALEARSRYGNFGDFTVTSELPQPGLTASRIELAVKFEFSEKSVPGSVVARIGAGAMTWQPQVALESMRIADLERGELALGGPGKPRTGPAESGAGAAEEPKKDEANGGPR